MLDAIRVQKTISKKRSKIVRSIYQKILLTKMAICLGIYIGDVVQVRHKSSSGFYREQKPIPTHRRSGFFDTIHYLYEKKGLQQVRVTKPKQGIGRVDALV